jgi:hypothetical protein
VPSGAQATPRNLRPLRSGWEKIRSTVSALAPVSLAGCCPRAGKIAKAKAATPTAKQLRLKCLLVIDSGERNIDYLVENL